MENQTNISNWPNSIWLLLFAILVIAVGTTLGIWMANRLV